MKGFRDAPGTAILIPESVPRAREVWTHADWKLLNRSSDLFKSKHVILYLRCDHPGCEDSPITKIPNGDGFLLRCNHLDRVFTKSF